MLKSGLKRMGTVMLVTVLCLAGSRIEAQADVVWEPMDDFYWDNARECQFVGKDYRTNGSDGYVTVYKEPGSDEEIARLKNGKRFYAGFSWTDKEGTVWLVLDLWGYEPEGEEYLMKNVKDGWLPIGEMEKIYSQADFRMEHEDSFEEYQGEMEGYVIQREICLWEYPGSEVMNSSITSYMSPGDEPSYESLYTDPEGRRWTYVGYYYTNKGWVCIDDPENRELGREYTLLEESRQEEKSAEDIAAEKEAAPDRDEAEKNTPEAADNTITGTSLLKIAGIMIAALTAVTAAVISLVFGKKK